jgi:DNA-directed RNA polymerase specialized sigma24 family protein
MDELPCDLGELIARMQAGSQEAGAEVFKRCRQLALIISCAILSKEIRSHYDPGEIVHETWIALRTGAVPPEVKADANKMRVYVQGIVRNLAHEVKRQYYGARRKGRRVPLAGESEPCTHGLSAEDTLRLKEVFETEVNKLSPKRRADVQAIRPLLEEGRKGAEIARLLGIAAKRVYHAIHWLRDKLDWANLRSGLR